MLKLSSTIYNEIANAEEVLAKLVELTAHLEPNPASLNVKKLEMAFAVDPLFHRTSAKFDEGGAKGLLLHNLPVQDGCAIVFDSCDAERPTAATQPPAPAPKLPLSCISNLLPRNFLELHISSEFSQRHEPAACDWASAADGSARAIPEHEASAPDEEEEGAEEGGAAEDEAASFDDDVPFDEPPDNEDDDGFAGMQIALGRICSSAYWWAKRAACSGLSAQNSPLRHASDSVSPKP